MEIKHHPEIINALSKLDAQLEAIFQGKKLAGMCAGVVYDQEIYWSKGYGEADVEKHIPVDTQTVFDIGSIVKIFTDTMLMQLRDAGKLNLDDPIEKYLPEFRLKSTFPNPKPPTFRQTAAHIAGIPREVGYRFNEAGIPALPTMDEILVKIKDMSFVYPPLSGVHYSNLGVYVMGYALGRIAGQPYKQYVQEHILEPLGMHSSGWSFTPVMEAHRGIKYVPLYDNRPRRIAPEVDFGDTGAPGGGFRSTVADLARFISFQFCEEPAGGKQILDGSTLKEMRLPVVYEPWGGIGIGWWLDRIADHNTVHHGGSISGCSAVIQLVPDLKLGVIILINEMIFIENQMAHDALELLIPAFAAALDPRSVEQPKPPLPVFAESCVGRYETPEDAWGMEIHISAGALQAALKYAGQTLLGFEMIQEDDLQFLIRGSSFDGERLSFEKDASGKITGIDLWGLPFKKLIDQ